MALASGSDDGTNTLQGPVATMVPATGRTSQGGGTKGNGCSGGGLGDFGLFF